MSKANKIMNQRNEYKNEMINELETLGFNVSVLDELIPTATKEEPKQSIVINKGRIVEVQTVKEIVIDNTDYETIDKLKEQIKSLEAQIAELKQPKKEQPKTNNSMAAMLERVRKAEENKKAKAEEGWTLESALEQQKAKLAKEAEEKEAAINNLPEHTLEYDVVSHKGLDTITHFAIQGKITLDKEYAFEATNNHHMPIIYGCLDMNTINTAKEIMTNKIDKFSFMSNVENNAANYDHINDAEFPLVVWRLTDDNGNVSYHGYTDKYVLIWDKKNFKVPARKMLKYALDKDARNYRKLEQQKNTGKLSDKFIAVCKELYADDFAVKRGVVYEGPIDDFEVKVPVANDPAFIEECDDLDL